MIQNWFKINISCMPYCSSQPILRLFSWQCCFINKPEQTVSCDSFNLWCLKRLMIFFFFQIKHWGFSIIALQREHTNSTTQWLRRPAKKQQELSLPTPSCPMPSRWRSYSKAVILGYHTISSDCLNVIGCLFSCRLVIACAQQAGLTKQG